MRVVIAGSRRLPQGHAPRLLVRFLAALDDDALVMLRRPRGQALIGHFERDVADLAGILHLDVEWWYPQPTDTTVGRASVYVRDIDMVEKADLIVLFLAADEEHEGYGGTQHLLDKALAAGRPCYAYVVDEYGNVSRLGEYDPDHLYADIAPST